MHWPINQMSVRLTRTHTHTGTVSAFNPLLGPQPHVPRRERERKEEREREADTKYALLTRLHFAWHRCDAQKGPCTLHATRCCLWLHVAIVYR